MKAVMFTYSLPRIALKKIGLGGDFFLTRYRDDWPEPCIHHPNQVKVETRLGGICASDLHQMSVSVSLYASIMASPVNPIPMGHEIVGTVVETAAEVESLRPGDRVVFNPIPRCSFYGFHPCPSCRNGNYQHCFCLLGVGDDTDMENRYGGRGRFGGFCGGGFGEFVVGFEGQFHKVPDHVPDETAVLTEPYTIALHAVTRHMPRDDETVMVVGAGIIGLLTIKALRDLGSGCRIISLARYPMQAEMAARLGADEVLSERNPETLYQQVAHLTGGVLFKPILSRPVLYGNQGPDLIFDCIASESSAEDDLRLVRSNGKIVFLGLGFTVTRKVDWSLAIWKEITISGTIFSGRESHMSREIEAFDLALTKLAEHPESFAGLVSHAFPVERFREAVHCVRSKSNHRALKVVLDFRGAPHHELCNTATRRSNG